MNDILINLNDSQFFSIQTDESTDITVYQQCGLLLRYFDNPMAKVRSVFFKLDPIEKANAESLFSILDSNFGDHGPLHYEHLVGFGSDGANVMLGARNSVLSRLMNKQPHLVAFHCNCHIAALIANNASKVLP